MRRVRARDVREYVGDAPRAAEIPDGDRFVGTMGRLMLAAERTAGE